MLSADNQSSERLRSLDARSPRNKPQGRWRRHKSVTPLISFLTVPAARITSTHRKLVRTAPTHPVTPPELFCKRDLSKDSQLETAKLWATIMAGALNILFLLIFFVGAWIAWSLLVWGWTNHHPWIEPHVNKLRLLLGLPLAFQVLCFSFSLPLWLNIAIAPFYPCFLITFYFAPSLIAARRRRSDVWKIFFINILGGFPVGWGIALTFALSEERPRGKRLRRHVGEYPRRPRTVSGTDMINRRQAE